MYVVGQQSPKGGRYVLLVKVRIMKIKTVYKRILWVLAALLLSVLCFFESVHTKTVKADGAETVYTEVMTDLLKDSSFDVSKYPDDINDTSLQVFQIAESETRELFLYVYQPSHDVKELIANGVNLSTSVAPNEKTGEKDFVYYPLTLLSSNCVFYKYRVDGLTVKSDVLRFYEIASIYRPFDKDIDDSPVDDNTTSDIACEVGQLWTATTYEDTILYKMDIQDTIKIESKHIGFIRYLDLKLFSSFSGTDSHYLAFSTDKPIDMLLEADVFYSYQVYSRQSNSLFTWSDIETLSQVISTKKNLERSVIFSRDNLFGDDYTYNRIQTVDEFLRKETEEFTAETKEALSDKEWVLRFHESSYYHDGFFTTSSDSVIQNYCEVWQYQIVPAVTVLRLKYEYDGDIYDLGVVDNISSGDVNPDNKDWDKPDKDDDWIVELFAWLLLGIGVIAIGSIFPPIVDLFTYLIKGIWWLVCLPFKLLGLGFKGIGKLCKGKGKK